MKRTSIILGILLVFQVSSVFAVDENADKKNSQTWEFYSSQNPPTLQELSVLQPFHNLGKDVSFYYEKFKEAYVTKEEVVPGDPMRRTVIKKPAIYNAVRALEKAYLRKAKDKDTPTETAQNDFKKVLEVALAAIDSDTSGFEACLQENRKDENRLMALFQSVSLKSIY